MNRRQLLALGAAAVASRRVSFASAPHGRFRAVAFDGFTVFDPRSVAARAAELFPGKSADLVAAWRTRQFEYTWLRTLSGRYENFWTVTEEALVFAARASKVELTASSREALMRSFLELKAYPDAAAGLRALKDAGLKLAFLANLTPAMLEQSTKSAGLEGLFDLALSTDRARAFKPDPRAYRIGVDALHLPSSEIAFAAFGGWDAAGAKSFGYPTYWMNRADAPLEELGVAPDATGSGFPGLLSFVGLT
jgi:2-haloacid dehalogenase